MKSGTTGELVFRIGLALSLIQGLIPSAVADKLDDDQRTIVETADSSRRVAVDGKLLVAAESPTMSVRSPLLAARLESLPMPAGYEDIERANLLAEIVVHPNGTASFLETIFFVCGPREVPECSDASGGAAPVAFELATEELVAETAFVPTPKSSLYRVTRLSVSFAAIESNGTLATAPIFNECGSGCCGQIGGTPTNDPYGAPVCELNDGGNQELQQIREMAYADCLRDNC